MGALKVMRCPCWAALKWCRPHGAGDGASLECRPHIPLRRMPLPQLSPQIIRRQPEVLGDTQVLGGGA